jgi:hypothetical protein
MFAKATERLLIDSEGMSAIGRAADIPIELFWLIISHVLMPTNMTERLLIYREISRNICHILML